MKTKIFIMICLFVPFAANNVMAQNKVEKFETIVNMGGQVLPCTGDYLWGDVILENMVMSHNWIAKVRDATYKGYLDEAGTIESGRVYELLQTAPGLSFIESTAVMKVEGRVIAVMHLTYHTTTNANGDVVVDKYVIKWECK
jgi:hypothetical protein